MSNLKLKRVTDFTAETGIPFDLLATEDLKNFFIRKSQFVLSAEQHFAINLASIVDHVAEKTKKLFETAVKAQMDIDAPDAEDESFINVQELEEFSYDMAVQTLGFGKIFPTKIFEAVASPFPAKTIEIEYPQPELIYSTDEEDPEKRILIFRYKDEYLVRLGNINKLLTGEYEPYLPELVFNVANDFSVYRQGRNYYCYLDAVPDIFTDIKTPAAEILKDRFSTQIFMTPTPDEFNFAKLNAQLFHSEPFGDGEFKIYKGNGFGMHKFFFKVDELKPLLGIFEFCSNEDDTFDWATLTLGKFISDEDFYCRLDYADTIVRHYLAQLWNGENQHNKRIQLGWQFIRWFRDFLPKFYETYHIDWDRDCSRFAQANCCEEPTEIENLPPNFEDGYLIARIAELTDVDRNVLAQCILDLREKTFLKRQELLKEHLYDLH
ncbi:MAG: hypothetical protein IJQ82_05650 [Selenomonadaceae bacterium]|nr:hypothetical protein [Selenomonadaceae bacterium]